MTQEPLIHSEIEDSLPADHPLAHTDVDCLVCHDLLHAENNECMQTWVETGLGGLCLICFVKAEIKSKGCQRFYLGRTDPQEIKDHVEWLRREVRDSLAGITL
jgi:hypothetical protein